MLNFTLFMLNHIFKVRNLLLDVCAVKWYMLSEPYTYLGLIVREYKSPSIALNSQTKHYTIVLQLDKTRYPLKLFKRRNDNYFWPQHFFSA